MLFPAKCQTTKFIKLPADVALSTLCISNDNEPSVTQDDFKIFKLS
jgi:hypothetical protein